MFVLIIDISKLPVIVVENIIMKKINNSKKLARLWIEIGRKLSSIDRLIESVTHRKELKEKADRIDELELERDALKLKVELLTSGESVQLTQPERRMVLEAIESPVYNEYVQTPATQRRVRDTWRSLREKIRESIRED